MAVIPYMPFYVADYLADTAHLSALESGTYLHLILAYWQRQKALPAGDDRLAAVARLSVEEWLKVRPALEEFFNESSGCWAHKRIESELQKFYEKSEKSRTAGMASWRKRKAETERTLNGCIADAHHPLNGCIADVERTFNHTDTDTDTDTKEEKLKSICFSSHDEKPKTKREPANGKRLDVLELPEKWQEWAMRDCGWSQPYTARAFEGFRDYWIARAGERARKLDWEATWRGWCRRDTSPQLSLGTAVGGVKSASQARETTTEAAVRIAKERFQKYGRL